METIPVLRIWTPVSGLNISPPTLRYETIYSRLVAFIPFIVPMVFLIIIIVVFFFLVPKYSFQSFIPPAGNMQL